MITDEMVSKKTHLSYLCKQVALLWPYARMNRELQKTRKGRQMTEQPTAYDAGFIPHSGGPPPGAVITQTVHFADGSRIRVIVEAGSSDALAPAAYHRRLLRALDLIELDAGDLAIRRREGYGGDK
jgi:hypothetical protein